jgi:hypothetical protein
MAPSAWAVVRMEAILPHEKEAGLPGRVDLMSSEPEGDGGAKVRTKGAFEKPEKSKAKGGWGLSGWFSRGGGGGGGNEKKVEERPKATVASGKCTAGGLVDDST